MDESSRESFTPGLYEIPTTGLRSDLERKSPALSEVQPSRSRYYTVDPSRFTSREEMQREQELLWPNVWLWAGMASDIPEVGSWLRFDLGSESFIITRSAENEFSAFYNVCQHRGNRLVDQEFGHQRTFVCSYHSWAYDLRGKSKHVTDRQHFNPAALCDRVDIPQVRCEVWAGKIFITMDEEAPSLRHYLGELAPILEIYHLEKMHVIKDIIVEMACNWKTVIDAFIEAYHIHITHSNVLDRLEDRKVQLDFFKGGHGRLISARGMPTSRWPAPHAVNPAQEQMLADAGIMLDEFDGGPAEVRRAVQIAKRRADTGEGLDYAGFSDNQLTDSWALSVFPNSWWNLNPEGCLGLTVYPHPTDPAKCLFHVMGLAPKLPEGVKTIFVMPVKPGDDLSGATRPPRQYINSADPDLEEVIGLTLWQDVRNLQESQHGMGSRGFKAIRLSEQEQLIQHHFAEIDHYLRPNGEEGPRNPA